MRRRPPRSKRTDPLSPYTTRFRSGYTDALQQSGIAADPALIVPAHFTVESSEASVDALLARGVSFDGIIAASDLIALGAIRALHRAGIGVRSEEHTSELQSLMRISYAVFCLKKKTTEHNMID